MTTIEIETMIAIMTMIKTITERMLALWMFPVATRI